MPNVTVSTTMAAVKLPNWENYPHNGTILILLSIFSPILPKKKQKHLKLFSPTSPPVDYRPLFRFFFTRLNYTHLYISLPKFIKICLSKDLDL